MDSIQILKNFGKPADAKRLFFSGSSVVLFGFKCSPEDVDVGRVVGSRLVHNNLRAQMNARAQKTFAVQNIICIVYSFFVSATAALINSKKTSLFSLGTRPSPQVALSSLKRRVQPQKTPHKAHRWHNAVNASFEWNRA